MATSERQIDSVEPGAEQPAQAESPTNRSSGSRWIKAAVAVLVVGIVAGITAWQLRPAPKELVGGAIVQGRQPAANFQLTDHLGQSTQLSQFQGKPVALTFIYTHCPDVCPLIATNMHQAYRKLGGDASKVALLAVTVDPENDDVNQIKAFSDQLGLTSEWHFMTGSRPELEAVWRRYGILSQRVDSNGRPVAPSARGTSVESASADQLEHSAPLFLVDKHGNLRAMLPTDFTTDTLVTNLRILLDES